MTKQKQHLLLIEGELVSRYEGNKLVDIGSVTNGEGLSVRESEHLRIDGIGPIPAGNDNPGELAFNRIARQLETDPPRIASPDEEQAA